MFGGLDGQFHEEFAVSLCHDILCMCSAGLGTSSSGLRDDDDGGDDDDDESDDDDGDDDDDVDDDGMCVCVYVSVCALCDMCVYEECTFTYRLYSCI